MKTFVLRLWTPGDGTADPGRELHGVLDGGGFAQPKPFRNAAALLALLHDALAERSTTTKHDPRG